MQTKHTLHYAAKLICSLLMILTIGCNDDPNTSDAEREKAERKFHELLKALDDKKDDPPGSGSADREQAIKDLVALAKGTPSLTPQLSTALVERLPKKCGELKKSIANALVELLKASPTQKVIEEVFEAANNTEVLRDALKEDMEKNAEQFPRNVLVYAMKDHEYTPLTNIRIAALGGLIEAINTVETSSEDDKKETCKKFVAALFADPKVLDALFVALKDGDKEIYEPTAEVLFTSLHSEYSPTKEHIQRVFDSVERNKGPEKVLTTYLKSFPSEELVELVRCESIKMIPLIGVLEKLSERFKEKKDQEKILDAFLYRALMISDKQGSIICGIKARLEIERLLKEGHLLGDQIKYISNHAQKSSSPHKDRFLEAWNKAVEKAKKEASSS